MKRAISVIMAVVMLLIPLLSNAEGMLKLPSGLTRIEAEAFAGNASTTVADIPYGTESIGPRAFADSVLEKIYIPRTVSFIAEDAFEGTDVLISSPTFSYAQTYAEAHGFAWEDCEDHYPLNVMDTASDILDQEFQFEDEELVGSELLSTEGETDPERLQLIEEYNALVLEENELIAACNDTSSLISAMEEMGGMLDSFSFEETAGGVGFSLGSGRLMLDNSLYNHLQAGNSITNAELSEDGTQVILTAGNKKYILYFNGNTLTMSAANGANAKSVMTLSRSDRSFAERVFAELENYLAIVNNALAGMDYYIALQLEHLKEFLAASQELHNMRWKLGLLPEGEYNETFSKALSKLKNFEKLDVLVANLSIPAQIASAGFLIKNWRELEAIDDHNHPTENDLSEEARKTSEKLKKEIVSLRGLYVTDAINTMVGLGTSVATLLSASATLAPQLPLPVKALCAKLTAGTALTKLLSFGIGLVLTGSEDVKWKKIKELDNSLHTTVSGKVYDASTKQPLQYVSVVCGGENVWTDSTGAYTIYLQPGTRTITFKRDNYQDYKLTVTIESGDQLERDIEMSAAEVTLTGVIRDSKTGALLPSVTILCGDRMELSGIDGSYSISLPIGPQTITYMLDGYQDQAITLMLEEDTSPVQDVFLRKKEPDPTPTPKPTPEPTPDSELPETPASYFEYTISNGEVTITGFSGREQDIVIPRKIEGYPVTIIGDRVFQNYYELTSATIPDSVTIIGKYAFRDCYALESVTIGNGVTTIGDYAFYDCRCLTNVTIPDSVTIIGEYAFYWCENLASVKIGNSVTTIGESAFGSSSLTSVTLPDSMTNIGYRAFYCCFDLTSVTIPDSVTIIGEGAFESCRSLTSVTIPDNVTVIEKAAFDSCKNLESVKIGNSVLTIGQWAFLDCESLTSVTIPDSVTTIGFRAFEGCDSLTSVTIGSGVTCIEAAFSDCWNLETVYVSNQYTANYFASDCPNLPVIWK